MEAFYENPQNTFFADKNCTRNGMWFIFMST